MNGIKTPGRMACDNASPINDIFRRTKKQPNTPHTIPTRDEAIRALSAHSSDSMFSRSVIGFDNPPDPTRQNDLVRLAISRAGLLAAFFLYKVYFHNTPRRIYKQLIINDLDQHEFRELTRIKYYKDLVINNL